MRDADQVDENLRGRHLDPVGGGVEGIADNRLATGGQLVSGTGTHKSTNRVAVCGKLRNQAAAHVAGAAGQEDRHSLMSLFKRFNLDRTSSLASAI